jgi:hypothetical protein
VADTRATRIIMSRSPMVKVDCVSEEEWVCAQILVSLEALVL